MRLTVRSYFCVGTYTEPILFGTGEVFKGKGEGIYICAFEDGEITVLKVLPLRNPSFLCIDGQFRRIYVVNELKEYGGESGGGVSEITYNDSYEMKLERSFCTGGADPCHIAMAPERDFLAISNFASGSVSIFRLKADGSLLPRRQLFQHEGSGPHPQRQRGPHAHSVIFTGNSGMLVPDLGIDQLVGYRYQQGEMLRASDMTIQLAPGYGPRFGEFSPDGAHFYLINEINSSVTHFTWNKERLFETNTVSNLPKGYEMENICSDLHITPDGRFLYASNRGHDSIASFAIAADGELNMIELTPCEGKTPRNFCIDPQGKYLLVANQDSNSIVTFAIKEDGHLTNVCKTEFPTPVCIKFF